MRREKRPAFSAARKHGYQPWQIIMLSTAAANWRKTASSSASNSCARALDFRQIVMRIERRGGVAGKMFAAARDPLLAQGVVECARQPNDFVDGRAVAAAAQRIVGLIVEGNVEHRDRDRD